jgi:methylglutaconyl-CoA hydratase
MSGTPLLDVRRDGPVARVYLNRPEVRNAFNDGVIAQLTATVTELGRAPQLRAIVLGGHGKAFCAGGDLAAMQAMAAQGWDENHASAQALAEMLRSLYECPLPLVARIHGDCIAGGVGLAAVCDIVVAAAPARFSISEARLGLMPATIGPYVLRAIGEQAARRYFLTAEVFDAARAKTLGLVHEVCDVDEIDWVVDGLVTLLVANGPQAVRACKRLVKDLSGQPLTDALRAETARRIADIRASDEGREGIRAFLEKRAPGWQVKS